MHLSLCGNKGRAQHKQTLQFLRSKGYSDEDAQALTQYPNLVMKIIGDTLSPQEGYRTLLKRLNRGIMNLYQPNCRNGPKREANVYKVSYTGV